MVTSDEGLSPVLFLFSNYNRIYIGDLNDGSSGRMFEICDYRTATTSRRVIQVEVDR